MYSIGIDLGGTHIGAGLVDADGTIICKVYTDTPEGRAFAPTVQAMADAVKALLEKAGVPAAECSVVGVGSPGISDAATGNIVYSANFSWHNEPLAQRLSALTGLPVRIANDADAAGWAEYLLGAGRGTKSCVTVTLGTGIGGGIVLDGKLFSGGMAGGAELGHVPLVADGNLCGCGKRGCAEAYASATAMVRRAVEIRGEYPDSALNGIADINARDVVDCARKGDAAAVRVFNEYINYLAHLLAGIINLLSPEVIALGGGVAGAGDFLFIPLRARVGQLVLNKELPFARIVPAEMGNDAGIAGAALLK